MFELPRFTRRWNVNLLPDKFMRFKDLSPYEVLVRVGGRGDDRAEPWRLPKSSELDLGFQDFIVVRLLRQGGYGCVFATGDFILLRRGTRTIIPKETAFDWAYKTIEDDEIWSGVGVVVEDPRARNRRAVYTPAFRGGYGTAARTKSRYWPAGVVRASYRLARAPALTGVNGTAAELVVARHDPLSRERAAPVAVRKVPISDLPGDGSYVWRSVDFECDGAQKYVFLLYSSGGCDLYLDYIHVDGPRFDYEYIYQPADDPDVAAFAAAWGAANRPALAGVPGGFTLR
jgi:hypothetical protein